MSGTELGGKTLVVAHALHPLEEGRFPGENFRSHLDTAADVFS
ncbi:MAG TPA: hypothetical protein VKQ34_03915 [Candidatus Saccharimonadales bacterium]|nr:hypothetical protein [Candidatus Saccharimonadales bacterium]